jgi:hypothetical protein
LAASGFGFREAAFYLGVDCGFQFREPLMHLTQILVVRILEPK